MQVSELFEYNEESPSCLTWKVDRYSGRGYGVLVVSKGDTVGSLNDKGYFTTWLNGRAIKCHNIVAELHGLSVPDGFVIDHKDGKPDNNRISNLRVVSRKINMRNMKKSKANTSGHTGVSEYSRIDCGKVYNIVVAYYKDPTSGKAVRKYFNADKLGREAALKLAATWRSESILKINAEGAGYTERSK